MSPQPQIPWKSLSTSSGLTSQMVTISAHRMDVDQVPMASDTVHPLLTKMGGPFDEVLTDVAEVTSVDDIFAMTTDDTTTLTVSQSDLSDLLGESLVTDVGLGDLDLDTIGGLEDFIDLSQLLLGTPAEEPLPAETEIVLEPTTSITGDVAVISTRKRKSVPVVVVSDHSGYISKRARVTSTSTVTSALSDDDSDVTTCKITHKERKTMRRTKNNVASKRSRETRKQKYVDMEDQARDLEVMNEELRERIISLELMAKEMKEILIQKMVNK